jgi:hypothetical protein
MRGDPTTTKTRTLWAFALSSIAIFMTALDNLVVATAVRDQAAAGRPTSLKSAVEAAS